MADIELKNVSKQFNQHAIIREITLTIAEGEFAVFVGPSGCGKSTLLRLIAGLESISSGDLLMGGTRANELTPQARGIGMVFQSYALYPHMTVFENMAFGLKLAGHDKAFIRTRVMEVAHTLQLSDLMERKPRELSGGQRQRVAIGRAITREPNILLFDEPLSNLDAALRVRMRVEIARLHKRLAATMIYVTHDQTEAMTLADKIVVMNNGQIEQVGTPRELFEYPINIFVAGFIGSPGMNFFTVALMNTDTQGCFVSGRGIAPIKLPFNVDSLAGGTSLTLGTRPEHLLVEKGEGDGDYYVSNIEYLGNEAYLYLLPLDSDSPLEEALVVCRTDVENGLTHDDRVHLRLQCANVHLFDGEGRALERV